MQELIMYAVANSTLGQVRDYANGRNVNAPKFTRGFGATVKLRLFRNTDVADPYPLADFANVVSWRCVWDKDFNQATSPVLVADNANILVHSVTETINGASWTFTEVVIPVPDMNTSELVALIGTSEEINSLNMELVGIDGQGNEIFGLQIKGFSARNRIYYGGTPTELPVDYLTADQARGLVAAGVVRQFSDDGETWHDSQTADDVYYRERSASSASSAWSSPIALLRGPQGDPGDAGTSMFTYVAFAEDANGTGFSLTPTSELCFRAEIHVNEEISTPTLSDFTDAGATFYQYMWPPEDDESSSSSSSGGGTSTGDMLKSVYDTNDDGKVDSAEQADKLATPRKIGNANFDGSSDISLSSIGAAATSHSHEISGVSGLQSALDGKAASSHTHEISGVSGLQNALDGKAASSHTHAVADVSGLQTALNGKAASSHSHAISDVSNLQNTLDGKIGSLNLNGETQQVSGGAVNVMALPIAVEMPAADKSKQPFLLYLGANVSGDGYVGALRTYQNHGDGYSYLDLAIVDVTATGTARVWFGYDYMDHSYRIRYDNGSWILESKYMDPDSQYSQAGVISSPTVDGQPWGGYTVSSSTWFFAPVTEVNPALKCHLYERNEAYNTDIVFVQYGSSSPQFLKRVGSDNRWTDTGTSTEESYSLYWNGTSTGSWAFNMNGFVYSSPSCSSETMPWELSGQTWTYYGEDHSMTLNVNPQFIGGWNDLGSIVSQGGN